jgi:hypothetical protein
MVSKESNMRRIIITLVALSACLSAAQSQARQLGGAPLPPSMVAGPSISPGLSPSFNVDRTRMGRTVMVPSVPSNLNTFSNRVESCMAGGAAAGLNPGGVGSFTRSCAN